MRIYEATYILDPDMEDEELTQIQEKFSNMITKSGGEIVNVDNWGKRKLAYEVKGKTEGVYIVMRINVDETTQNTLKRNFNISDKVLKSLIIRLN